MLIKNSGSHFGKDEVQGAHVLEIPKLLKELRDGSSDLELWAKFVNAERKEEFDMLAEKPV